LIDEEELELGRKRDVEDEKGMDEVKFDTGYSEYHTRLLLYLLKSGDAGDE
jgi:hypothetical protein